MLQRIYLRRIYLKRKYSIDRHMGRANKIICIQLSQLTLTTRVREENNDLHNVPFLVCVARLINVMKLFDVFSIEILYFVPMEESQTPVVNDGGGRVNERRTQERNSVTRRLHFCELTNTRSRFSRLRFLL